MKGVVAGVRDYGNRMGIPTVNGAIYFDDRYLGNPLVYCGNIGLMDKDKAFKHPQSGNLVVVVGGRTGRDGIHGATFSSVALDEGSPATAVQIGDPITQKKFSDAIIKEIRKEAAKAEHVLLATDPDREGEAISWHISNLLGMD